MESKHPWFYCTCLVNLVLACRHWVRLYAQLAPNSLASRHLFIVRIHLSDISYWAYCIGLFQHDPLASVNHDPKNILTPLLILPVVWYSTYARLHELSHAAGLYLVGGKVIDYKLIPRFWLGEFAGAWITPRRCPPPDLASKAGLSAPKSGEPGLI
jgi:hypothetical protein